ncbi:MAG: 4-alpha-glucanotransferase, partial [Planctomycetota bacterium]|nr:4-alpha-glucanotransferase [Planctomycetota bacterium]
LDIDDRVDLGLLTPEEAEAEHRDRTELRGALVKHLKQARRLEPSEADDSADADDRALRAIHAAVLEELADSDAGFVLATLEDLWLEESPQNTPGTSEERLNWRRRCARSIEQIEQDQSVAEPLRRVARQRRMAGS